MDNEPSREEFDSDKGYQGLQRLLDASSELNHGTWLGARSLSEHQKQEGIFYFLLAMDPLVEAYDKLPPEVKSTFPPLPEHKTTPPGEGVALGYIEKLKRVCRLFAVNEEVVMQALKEVW